MAASLADILQDPNYVNANEATKKAIFDKYAPLDPNYAKANGATQEAIRIKFGVATPRAAESEGVPTGPRTEAPGWAKEYPGLYKAAVTTRQMVGPTVEMLGGYGGALLGGTAGTFGAGPFGTAMGGVTGAGLGYGAAKQGLHAVDVALGLQQPDTVGGEFQRAAGNVIEGATGGPRDVAPFDYDALRERFKGVYIANNGYTREMAIDAVAKGHADAVAFGRSFISNPDLVRRLKLNAPLQKANSATMYGGGAEGYTDYPTMG